MAQDSRYRFLADSQRAQKNRQLQGSGKRLGGKKTAAAAESFPEGRRIEGEAFGRLAPQHPGESIDLGLKTFTTANPGSLYSTGSMSQFHRPTASAGTAASSVDIQRLQERIQALLSEKEAIERAQAQQQERLEKQRASWLEERAALVGGAGSSAADKIVRLSRKNRELSAEIAAEKSQALRLKQDIKDLKADLAERHHIAEKPPPGVLEVENHRLQDQLSNVTGKMTEYRNQCQKHKQELRVMNKLLIRELGDGADIQSMVQEKDSSSGPGWRGRQQQITVLQAKVSELQHTLKQCKAKLENASRSSSKMQESTVTETNDLPEFAAFADQRQVKALDKMDKMKRHVAKEALADLTALQTSHKELQQRYDASRARCQTLANQLQTLKGQVERLQGKSERDDHILQSLTMKSPRVQSPPQHTVPVTICAKAGEEEKLKSLCAKQAQDIHQLQCKVVELQLKLREQLDAAVPEDAPASVRRHDGKQANVPAQSTRGKAVSGASSLSTVSLPSIHGGGMTVRKDANGSANHRQVQSASRKPAPKFAKLDLTTTNTESAKSPSSSAMPIPSAAVAALQAERDHLRQLTSRLIEQNNSLTQAPSSSVAVDDSEQLPQSSQQYSQVLNQLQKENKQLRTALSSSHQAKVTALDQFKLAIEQVQKTRHAAQKS